MNRFNPKIGAGVLGALGLVYFVAALATGHSAHAEPPPDLRADKAGLNVWKTMSLMLSEGERLAIVDLRPAERFDLYHLPAAKSLPGAGASEIAAAASGTSHLLVVAATDAVASKRVAELAALGKGPSPHFLIGGAREWYLTVELPVALFSDQPAPRGYDDAMAVVHSWLGGQQPAAEGDGEVSEAIQRLAASPYSPSLLAGKKKPKPSGKKKKIAGGCG